MPDPASAEAKVRETLAQVSKRDPDSLEPDQELLRDLQMDSIATLDLLMELEEYLETEISEADAAGLVTVGDVVRFARERCGGS